MAIYPSANPVRPWRTKAASKWMMIMTYLLPCWGKWTTFRVASPNR
jgi:hypothetical protein